MSQKLLFVCLGNICRSPTAEGITNHLLRSSGYKEAIICDSAGTAAYHIGSPQIGACNKQPDAMA